MHRDKRMRASLATGSGNMYRVARISLKCSWKLASQGHEPLGPAMKRASVVVACLLTLLGWCAIAEAVEATGGSRSDNTVQILFEYHPSQKRIVDDYVPPQGLEWARRRCRDRNYADAKLSDQTRRCQQVNENGNCIDMLITVNYQCTGGAASSN